MSTSLRDIPHTSALDPAYAAGCVRIDGQFVPIYPARIPITDTGFTRSDCTYELVASWHGRFFRLDDHLARFERSWQALHLNPLISRVAMREVLIECVQRAGLADAYVEMIVTRGSPPPGDRDPRNFNNRFYASALPYVWLLKPDDQLRGSHLVIARDVVRIDQNAVDRTVKNFHWDDLTRGLFEAFAREADTAVLLNAAGEVTEGPGFNLLVVSAGRLCTPRSGVLLGITRDTVMQLAARAGIATSVTMFGAEHLRKAEEIFLTSTAGGVMPVTRLDGQPVGDGQPGAITLALRQAYWDAHHEPQWTTPVRH